MGWESGQVHVVRQADTMPGQGDVDGWCQRPLVFRTANAARLLRGAAAIVSPGRPSASPEHACWISPRR